MAVRRWGIPLLAGTTAAVWLSICASGAFAAVPGWNRDIAGAPRTATATTNASIALTVRTCPAGYDPAADGADFATDCNEPAGDTSFQLSSGGTAGPSASTGTSGDAPQESTVRFTELATGRYTLFATAPAGIDGAFLGSCMSDARSFDSYPVIPFATIPNGRITLEILDGESLACDWYQLRAPSE
jgi:hypothetical protein